MKQLLVIAIALTSVNAFATRARMNALANAPHLTDTQSIYGQPTDVFAIGSDFASLESGVATDTVAAPAVAGANAEGMILRSMGDSKVGVALGHQSMGALRGQLLAAPVIKQQNPIELIYGMKNGDMNLAGILVYSNYNDKTPGLAAGTIVKESSTALRLGASSGPWVATLSLGLVNTAQDFAGNKFTGSSDMNFDGNYMLNDIFWFVNLNTSVGKTESAAGVETGKVTNGMNWKLGALHSHKKDANELFYSIALESSDTKTAGTPDTKTTALKLPITIGVEVDAASWLTVRGSVSQSTFIANSKTSAATTTAELAPGANTTTVAVGAGLKFNKLTLDGALLQTAAGAAGQSVNTANLLAQVGATYWF
ncbi:MAG: hypothetical protein AABY53_06275 [Bdellovibrionota bacterium]